MDFSTRLRGINPTNTVFYSPQPRAEVYCLLMNFKITKLANLREGQQIHTHPRFMCNESRYKHTHYAIAFIVNSTHFLSHLRLKSAIKCT